MLGRTANGIYWMFRLLERSENLARLLATGLHITLTRTDQSSDEWESVLTTAGQRESFLERGDRFDRVSVIDFLLRDRSNPSSIRSVLASARSNARQVRASLTREVWEATNTAWLTVNDALARRVHSRELPRLLETIKRESAIVRGSLTGTMLRNDIYDFARLGTFVERADNTARILDVKYYVLLPSAFHVGTSIDNVQWETILRSLSAQRAYRWRNAGEVTPIGIVEFLVLDRQMPRSLAFCYQKIDDNLRYLAEDYGHKHECHDRARMLTDRMGSSTVDSIIDGGLHEFLGDCIAETNALGRAIEHDYRFNA